MFLPLGIITKKTLKNIMQPKITPTERNAKCAPKTFVKENEIRAPIISNDTGKIILLYGLLFSFGWWLG